MMFNNNYPYRSSMSKTAIKSFKDLSNIIKKFKPKKILEIEVMMDLLLEILKKETIGIEPCANVEKITKNKNIIPIQNIGHANLRIK